MDIQSAVLNQLFVLFPVIIQGWITPVRPAGIAHGGIPQVLYDGQSQGLPCLIDPWPELQLQSWTMAVMIAWICTSTTTCPPWPA
ncbi:hypothetical protein [Pseudomonas baetica]|uniref:hypothetical protein n=1 Tax=Pseudomonas baetica TaxID=674054 RepID=UPI001864F004|nr:hypothetical protein [Pseudomonas baetica]